MKKGFYVIGRDIEHTECFNLGIDLLRFDTLDQAKKEKDKQEDELVRDNVKIEILEVD